MADRPPTAFPVTPTLVGRDRELASLRDALAAAMAGRGSSVLIGGVAGIGKTTLVEVLTSEAAQQDALVLVGRCYDLTETPPYGPWVEALARAPGGDDLLVLPTAVLPPEREGVALSSQYAVIRRVQAYLAALAAKQPLVLLLDDLHWADLASLDLLRLLARGLHELPLLLLATYREDELTRRHPLYALLPILEREAHATRLSLRRFDAAGVRALVVSRYRLRDADSTRLVAWLDSRAEGNAFFTTQLFRALADEGVLRLADDGWVLGDLGAVGLPTPLRQVLDARLERLGEEARYLLGIAAVIGHEVPLTLWATVAGTDEDGLFDTVERAVGARLLAESPDGMAVRFVHALVREALYEGMLALRRRRVHRAVGEALAAMPGPDPDAVAYHFRQAGDARAVTWLVAAGERAIGAFAWLTAANRYEAAVALLGEDEAMAGERGWLVYRLARMRRFTDLRLALGNFEEAWRLAEIAGDHILAASVQSDLGNLRLRGGEIKRGLADLRAGVEALEVLPHAEHGPLVRLDAVSYAVNASRRGSLACWLALTGHYAEALPMAVRFLATASAPTPGSGRGASVYADAQYGLGVVLAMLGQPEEARAAFARAREAYRTVEHFVILGDVAATEMYHLQLVYRAEWLGERERLAREGEEALSRALDSGVSQLASAYSRLPLLVLAGRWAEARDVAESAAHDHTHTTQFTASLLGPVDRACGESASAWAKVRAALPQGPATEPGTVFMPEALYFQRLAALLVLDDGDLPGTHAWMEAHDRWLAWSGAVPGHVEGALGWAAYHRAAGDLGLAREQADAALSLATEPRQPLALLASHRTLGEIDTVANRHADARAHLDAALALSEACAAPYERALTLLGLAELYATTEEREGCGVALAEARAILEPLGARLALVRADALATRLAAVPAPPAPASPFGLTPRELDVLRLLAEGLTDLQIGERLYVSRSTVNGHTRAIYGKLGVNTRAAATRLALDYGLR